MATQSVTDLLGATLEKMPEVPDVHETKTEQEKPRKRRAYRCVLGGEGCKRPIAECRDTPCPGRLLRETRKRRAALLDETNVQMITEVFDTNNGDETDGVVSVQTTPEDLHMAYQRLQKAQKDFMSVAAKHV